MGISLRSGFGRAVLSERRHLCQGLGGELGAVLAPFRHSTNEEFHVLPRPD
jgi:hypothetical protein